MTHIANEHIFTFSNVETENVIFWKYIFLYNESADKLNAVSSSNDIILRKICTTTGYQESVYFSVLVWHKFHDPTW